MLPIDFLLYVCQIVDNFYLKIFSLYVKHVLSSNIKNFCTCIRYSLQTTI